MASDRHTEKAKEIRHLFWMAPFPSDEVSILADALANAEREGMKRAVEIAQAEVQRLNRLKTEAEIISWAILSEAKESE